MNLRKVISLLSFQHYQIIIKIQFDWPSKFPRNWIFTVSSAITDGSGILKIFQQYHIFTLNSNFSNDVTVFLNIKIWNVVRVQLSSSKPYPTQKEAIISEQNWNKKRRKLIKKKKVVLNTVLELQRLFFNYVNINSFSMTFSNDIPRKPANLKIFSILPSQ